MALNAEQLRAAHHPAGEAALLLAGAGSGKTTTLTERIAWLIEQAVPPRRILALTFTNKAAREIAERVLQKTGLAPELAPRLCTIHALALSFIRRNPEGFGLGNKVSPLDDYDQHELLRKIIEREPEGGKHFPSNQWKLREKISFHRARGIGFAIGYTAEVHEKALEAHSGYHAMEADELRVWSAYEQEKLSTSVLDFDDMIWFVIRRMDFDPEWLVKVQSLFHHVIVDECQDTNHPQFQLITNLLGPGNRNLFLTGDVSQSIYAFSGAKPQLILDYAEDWRGRVPVIYRLERNHRSVPEVVNLANAIQKQMTATLPLHMHSYRGEQGEQGACRVLRGIEPRDLAYSIAKRISDSPTNYRAFAILVRSATQVRDLEGELIRFRIPYVVRGGRGLLQTEEVRDVLSYVRLASNPCDFSAMARASSAPKCGLGDKALEQIREHARQKHGGDLVQASIAMGSKMTTFGSTVHGIQRMIAEPLRAFDAAFALSGYKDHLRRKYAKEPDKIESKMENLARLREMIAGLTSEGGVSTEDLIFQLTMDRTEQQDERGAVTISTIHSAKGLEWDQVFIFNVVKGVLPHTFATSEEECEEERRLWYVAVTRARNLCYITVAQRVQIGRNWCEAKPSPFLLELGIA